MKIFLAIIMLLVTVSSAFGQQVMAYVESAPIKDAEHGALWVDADFSSALESSISQFANGIRLVGDPADADVRIVVSGRERSRGQSFAKRYFLIRGADAFVSAKVLDAQSSQILWVSPETKDTSRIMDTLVMKEVNKRGRSKATDRLAKRMQQALKKGQWNLR